MPLAVKSPIQKSPQGHNANQTGFSSDKSQAKGSGQTERKRENKDPDPIPAKQPCPKIPSKTLCKVPRPKPKKSMAELCQFWNRKVCIGLTSKTAKGWLKKTKRQHDNQGRVLRQLVLGGTALQEIKFYQRCQTFLVPQVPFNHLVREVYEELRVDEDLSRDPLQWQVNALFALQTLSEAYIAGFFLNINLYGIHHKVVTINRKDMWLAVQVRGREQVEGKPNVSDTVVHSTVDWMSTDPLEKHGH